MDEKVEILIVDDDASLASNLRDILKLEGYGATVAGDRQTALTLCREQVFDIALVDIRLSDMSGAKLINELAELSPGMEYIIITGYASLETAIEAVSQKSIVAYEIKPLDMDHILFLIKQVVGRKRAEEQLSHMGRLAAIGELISGIAHELNNPLTGVLGYSELVLAADIPQEVKRDVEVIHDSAQRAATIVRNLLTFARRQKPEKQYLNVNDLIKHTLEMRSYELKVCNIEVLTEFADELPGVMADPQQMEQVFLNIIRNAEQAMLEDHGRGTLTAKTEATRDMVRVSFTDDGPGIPQENLSRVFDPFFTTKEPGKGTGLGLSICVGIITEHGGRIYAESKTGKGATFFIELPV